MERSRPEERSLSLPQKGRIIGLNVGGFRYCTTLSTLRSRGENFLTGLVESQAKGIIQTDRDEKGYLFIDRNGRAFEAVLEFLRTGLISLPPGVTRKQLELEFDFYQIKLQQEEKKASPLSSLSSSFSSLSSNSSLFHCIADEKEELNACASALFNAWNFQFSPLIRRLDAEWEQIWSSLVLPQSCCIEGDSLVFLVLYPEADRCPQQLVFISHQAHSSLSLSVQLSRHAFSSVGKSLGNRILWFPQFFSKYLEKQTGLSASVFSRSGGDSSLSMTFNGWSHYYVTCRINIPVKVTSQESSPIFP